MKETFNATPTSNERFTGRSYEQSEAIDYPNRETFQKSGLESLRAFYQQHPEARHQINRVFEFIETARELYETSDREVLSLGHDNKGTLFAVFSEENDSQKAMVARMNPFDGPDATEVFTHLPVMYDNDERAPLLERSRTATISFEDELGNTTVFSLKNHDGGNTVTESDPAGDNSTSSPLLDVRTLDYDLRYDLGISHDEISMSDSSLKEKIHEAMQREEQQQDIARIALATTQDSNEGELQLS